MWSPKHGRGVGERCVCSVWGVVVPVLHAAGEVVDTQQIVPRGRGGCSSPTFNGFHGHVLRWCRGHSLHGRLGCLLQDNHAHAVPVFRAQFTGLVDTVVTDPFREETTQPVERFGAFPQ